MSDEAKVLVGELNEALVKRADEYFGWGAQRENPFDILRDMMNYLRARPQQPDVRPSVTTEGEPVAWRHKKRGSTYTEVARGELQAEPSADLCEGDRMIAYRGNDGRVWFRREEEFDDGRFERIAALPAPKAAENEPEEITGAEMDAIEAAAIAGRPLTSLSSVDVRAAVIEDLISTFEQMRGYPEGDSSDPCFDLCGMPCCDEFGCLHQKTREARAALSQAPATDDAARREDIARIIEEKMLDTWNEICSDTNCHPLDIKQIGGRRLEFHSSHWSAQTAENAADAIIASGLDGGRKL